MELNIYFFLLKVSGSIVPHYRCWNNINKNTLLSLTSLQFYDFGYLFWWALTSFSQQLPFIPESYVNRRIMSSMITKPHQCSQMDQFNWLHITRDIPQHCVDNPSPTKTVTEQCGKQFNPHLTRCPSLAGLGLSSYYNWLPGSSLSGYPLLCGIFRSLSLGSQSSVHHLEHCSACSWWITIHLPEEEARVDAVVFCTSKGLKHLAED